MCCWTYSRLSYLHNLGWSGVAVQYFTGICMYLYVLSFVVAQATAVMNSLASADTRVCVMDHLYTLHPPSL